MRRILLSLSLVLLLLGDVKNVQARAVKFDILQSTPVGSWQIREDIETNKKGKQIGTLVRTSLVGKESRNGLDYLWIETAIESFKISKKGKRKKQGDRVVMKTLVPMSAFEQDSENVLSNLRGFGEEIIVKNGNEKPMRMTGAGGFREGMMQLAQVEIKYNYTDLGQETVEVPAGEFTTQKINGSGSVSTKVMFRKMNVESTNTAWISSKVPFGFVKTVGESVVNGKNKTTSESVLLEYSNSGAISEITGEIQEAPQMPNMKNLFGS